MESTLSISFNLQQTALTLTGISSKGLGLHATALITEPLDVTNDDAMGSEGLALLHEQFFTLPSMPERIVAVLPPEAMLLQFMPTMPLGSEQEVMDMLSLEIIQNSPDHSVEDFDIELYTLTQKLDGTDLLLAVMTERTVMERVRMMVAGLNIPTLEFMPRQIASHSAFRYSYPELHSSSVAFFSLMHSSVECSVITNSGLAYYSITPVANRGAYSDVCDSEIDKILSSHVPFLDAVYVFGGSLTQEVLSAVQSRLAGLVSRVERCNPFRMMTAQDLDERTRAYCSRLAHHFVPCIGATLPRIHQSVKVPQMV